MSDKGATCIQISRRHSYIRLVDPKAHRRIIEEESWPIDRPCPEIER